MSEPKPPPGFELDEDVPPPPGFEVDAPVSDARAPSASMAESALQGYGQGASFGFSDELGGTVHEGIKLGAGGVASVMKTAAGRAILRKLNPAFQQLPDGVIDGIIDGGLDEGIEAVSGVRPRAAGGPGLPGSGYTVGRDQMRGEIADAQASNPKTFFAGNIAGAMSVPLPGGGAAKPLQTVIGRSLESAAKFGGAGAVSGFGNSDADLLRGEFGDLAADTAVGAGIGGGMGMLTGPAAYGWARHARPALESMAKTRAVSAVAPSASIMNRLRKKGVRNADDIEGLGEEILDLDILRPFGSAAGAQQRTAGVLAREGEVIGSTLDKADDLVSRGVARPPSRDLQRQLVSQSLVDAADTPATRALMPGVGSKLLQSVGDDVPRPDNFPSGFREMWKNKSQLQSVLKPDEFSSEAQKLYREGVKGYTKGIYGQLEGAVGPDDLVPFREATKRYGTAKKIEDLLSEQVTRKAANQPVSAGDMGRGLVMDSVTPGGAPVATLISSLMRGRTDSTLATGARSMSKMRMGNPGAGMKATSEAARQELSDDEEDAVQAFLQSP